MKQRRIEDIPYTPIQRFALHEKVLTWPKAAI